jgi:hypothetical protein
MSTNLALILIIIYFAPWITACYYPKRNRAAIAALNLFAGWTIIGWIVALVWALCKDAPAKSA